MNIARYLRVIFLSLINRVKNWAKMFEYALYGKIDSFLFDENSNFLRKP